MSNVDIPKSILKTPQKRISTVVLHWFLCNSATKNVTGKEFEQGNYVFCPVSRRWRRTLAMDSPHGGSSPSGGLCCRTPAAAAVEGARPPLLSPEGLQGVCGADTPRKPGAPLHPLPRRAEHRYRTCSGTPGLGSPPEPARAARRGRSRRWAGSFPAARAARRAGGGPAACASSWRSAGGGDGQTLPAHEERAHSPAEPPATTWWEASCRKPRGCRAILARAAAATRGSWRLESGWEPGPSPRGAGGEEPEGPRLSAGGRGSRERGRGRRAARPRGGLWQPAPGRGRPRARRGLAATGDRF